MNRNLSKLLLAGACALAISAPVFASDFKVLHAFKDGKDGKDPESALAADGQGNFYGTTYTGGSKGSGTVFRIDADGHFSSVYAFKGDADGAYPYAGLTLGSDGALYGTTQYGGDMESCQYGCGTIFRLTPDGSKTVLYKFKGGGTDGANPYSGVTFDHKGNVYGVTFKGGDDISEGYGTLYKLRPNGTETVLHVFHKDGTDGWQPAGKVVLDKAGNIYGTTTTGGSTNEPCSQYGCGVVFKVARDGTETLFHIFKGKDGANPWTDLITDKAGNLYGTTTGGGTTGFGTVFKISPAGDETVLHSFAGNAEGRWPGWDLVTDAKGNFYGTTYFGGDMDFGVIFKLAPDGTETVLYSLHAFSEGKGSEGGVVRGAKGTLYGTASGGGSIQDSCAGNGCGTVFRLTP